ncbi:MAG: hypothetical protein WA761_03905 [Thermoplasmata archaeon]
MDAGSGTPTNLTERLALLMTNAGLLEAEGVPFPIGEIREAFGSALELGDGVAAESALRRGEVLYERTARDWTWVRELLQRSDEVRACAAQIGMDVQHLDARVGDPREQLRAGRFSGGALERAAASASLALAVLNDAIPKYCVQEAAKLGHAIRKARDRGENVRDATEQFRRFLNALEHEHIVQISGAFRATRTAVSRIPRAPAVPSFEAREEVEILLEARNLARRLNRIKHNARDAHSAARLMGQVRAALSEDRRSRTPEEEVEDVWSDVDRFAHERGFTIAAEPMREETPGLSASAATPDRSGPRSRRDRATVARGPRP